MMGLTPFYFKLQLYNTEPETHTNRVQMFLQQTAVVKKKKKQNGEERASAGSLVIGTHPLI